MSIAYHQAGGVIDHKDGMSLTALHHACARGKIACVQVLLKHGADANSRDKVRQETKGYSSFTGVLNKPASFKIVKPSLSPDLDNPLYLNLFISTEITRFQHKTFEFAERSAFLDLS